MLTLASISSYFIPIFVLLFIGVCVFMMLVILIQKPKGGGLSGAFGGAGGAVQNAFGTKVGDMLTWVTVFCFALFLLLAMALTWTISPATASHAETGLDTTPGTTGPAGTPAAPTPQQTPANAPTTIPATQPTAG